MTANEPNDFSTVETWLDRLLDVPAEQRAALLAQCHDSALRERLQRLLACEACAGPLDTPPLDLARSALGREATPSRLGARIGAYRMESLLGEGGMATVWLARRDDGAITHEVAVKCLKSGLATPELRARFLREQQILARLTHPNIARLYDVGIADDGVPYIVMERVDGLAITRWCDERRLNLQQRLQLFRKVLEAVAFAHQNLVVHRDLKPANILVTADGTPKLLDFGIAKPLDGDDATQTQTRALTPAYAAPEQFRGDAVTTATDVYALGTLLFDLLAGCRPPRRASNVDAAANADEPVALPSQTLARWRRREDVVGVAHPADDAARARGFASAARLARALRGDLDTIVARACDPVPARRYAGAAALDADIERFLNRQPLQAQRDRRLYRLHKFARRNWFALAAIGTIIMVLGIGATVAFWQAAQARREAARAEAVQNFLFGIFEAAQPGPSGATVLTTRELVERAAANLRERLQNEPDASAQLLLALGRVYRKMALNDQATALFERAVAIQRTAPVSERSALADSLEALGDAYDSTGNYDQATAALAESLSLLRAQNAEPARVANTLIGLAQIQSDTGKAEAPATIKAALAEIPDAANAEAALRLKALMVQATILRRVGDIGAAIEAARAALEYSRQAFGAQAVQTARAWNVLGTALRQNGQFEEAERALREVAAYDRDVAHQLEPAHLYSLGSLQIDAGEYAAAIATLQQALDAERITVGADVIDIGSFEEPLARALLELGRSAEAEPIARDAVARYEREETGGTGEIAQMRLTLGDVLNARGNTQESAALYKLVLDAARNARSRRGREQRLWAQLGSIAAAASTRASDATRSAIQALLDSSDFSGDSDPVSRLRLLTGASEILLDADDPAAAENRARAALELAPRLPMAHPQVAHARLVCAEALAAEHHSDDADPLLASALPVLSATLPADHPLVKRAHALARNIGAAKNSPQ